MSGKVGEERKRRESLKSTSTFVGNYEILQTIGEGSFAKVKLAKHRLTHQKVAIKVIDKQKLPDEYAVKNMYREAQIMRNLDHPNIIKLFEVMETKKNLFLILEYAPKGEFLEYIIANGQVPEEDAKRFTKQIISALEHTHAHSIVHRDLKAENFLLDDKLNIKLSDFGLSNFFDTSKLLGTFCGSPVYSAPELIEGKKYIGPEVDAWSLGINVYAMVVGDLPFADSNLAALYDSILKGKYNIPDFVPEDCRDFISKLLVVNPKKRAKISQLLEHPWLSGQIAFLESMDEKVSTFRPYNESELDQAVIDTMEQLGLEKKSVVQGVLTGKFNQAAGLYFLLTHQKAFGDGALRLSSLSLNNLNRDSEGKEREGKDDVSEELANVLFQVERQRGPSTTKRQGVTERRPSKSIVQHGLVSSESQQVVQLPPIPGAQPIEHFSLKAQPISPAKSPQPNTVASSTPQGVEPFPGARRESTKFGLTKHNATDKKIPIDEALYQPEEKGADRSGPRTIKYAFNCFCHTKLHAAIFFEKLYSILDKNDVQWYNDDYLCVCEWGDIKFEIEICKLPRQAACGIRVKRINGDIWEFKKLSSKITADLDQVSA